MILNEELPTSRGNLAGVVLTDGILPHDAVMDLIRSRNIPFISTTADVSAAATTIARMTVKTEVGDKDKIGLIQSLIHEHVQVDRIVQLVQSPGPKQMHFGEVAGPPA